jgi:hypothetical protein
VRRLRRVRHPRGVALAAYLGLSLLYFGVPVAAHPGRRYIGEGVDPQIFIWSLAWWPHAIFDWTNPIVSHAVWAPVGVNLSWVTSTPGLAVALAPVTLLAGPVVSYNVIAVLMPALAAWTAFLLCRHVTGSFWPSLAGGYLFGFSSYMLGQTEGHLHMTSVFLLPLVALVVLRFVEGSLDGRGLAIRLGLLLAAQIAFSTEVFLTLTVALAVALGVAFATLPSARERLRRAALPIVGGYAIATVLASPFLYYAFTDFEGDSLNEPADFPADLLNLIVPTHLSALSIGRANTIAAQFKANPAENGAYLGLPLLVILGWFCWRSRRRPAGRFLAVLLGIGIVAELGTALTVRGATYFPLPFRLLAELPAFNHVLPVRFAVYVSLAAAVMAALWGATRPPRESIRVALLGLAVVAILPHLWHDDWRVHPTRPAFLTAEHYRTCLRPNENVLALPHPSWGNSMLWQAEAGFRYRMANGSLSTAIPDRVPDREIVLSLLGGDMPAGGAGDIVRFARHQGASVIMVEGEHAEPWRTVLENAGYPSRAAAGVILFRLAGRTPADCPASRPVRTTAGSRGPSAP